LIDSGGGVSVTGGGVVAKSDRAGWGVLIEIGSVEKDTGETGAGVSMTTGSGVSSDTGSGVFTDIATSKDTCGPPKESETGSSATSSRMSPIASSMESREGWAFVEVGEGGGSSLTPWWGSTAANPDPEGGFVDIPVTLLGAEASSVFGGDVKLMTQIIQKARVLRPP